MRKQNWDEQKPLTAGEAQPASRHGAQATRGPEPRPRSGDIGPGASRGPVMRVTACNAFTLGTSGAAVRVVPWVPLWKAPVLADTVPRRGAGQSHFPVALVTRPAGRKPSSWAQGTEARAHPCQHACSRSFPSKDPERAFTTHDKIPNHSCKGSRPRAALGAPPHPLEQGSLASQHPQCTTPGPHPVHPPGALDHRSQHPTAVPACSSLLHRRSEPTASRDPFIPKLLAAKTRGWESHQASRAAFLPCRRLLNVPGHHSPQLLSCRPQNGARTHRRATEQS